MLDILYTIIIYPITQIIEFVFMFSQKLLKDTGISIICVSAAVNILCLPLYMVAEYWQETERNIQRLLQDKIKRIKAVFKGDERYMILSAYYRQNHYHPVYALRSSFGLLIQIPFFIAAYSYLTHSELLRGTSFLFITDLGKPDALIPAAGGINLLPILMTLINCISGAIYTKGLNVKEKVQLYGMAFLFLILLYNSPSGLVLYWTLNNLFSLGKNAYLKIPFRKKDLILFGIISIIAFLFSFYARFLHHGNFKIRSLVALLSIIIGLLPWIIPHISKIRIKFISWTPKQTFYLFLSSILLLWATTGFFIPSMLIESSPQEFSYIDNIASPLYFIYNSTIQSFGLFIFWPLMIYLLFSEKIKKILSILMSIISVSALCNIFIFPGKYGAISNHLVFSRGIDHNLREIMLNISVLLVISVFLFFIYNRGLKKTLTFIGVIMFIAISAFSLKNIHTINSEYKKLSEYYRPEDKTITEISPILRLSKTGNNVIVIMIDMAQSVFIPYIFEESPELYEKYDGFTYYPNTVTYNGWTRGGAPPLFGGYEYTPLGMNKRPEVSFREKHNEALLLMSRLFSSEGYTVTITDPPYADSNWIPDLRIFDNEANVNGYITDGVYTDYWLSQNNINLPKHSEVLKRNILWYAIFRGTPLAFRQGIYYTGAWCAPFSEHRMRLFLNGYSVLDYLDKLTTFENSKDNSVVIMVNNTTHENLLLQPPDYRPQVNVTINGGSRYGNGRFIKEVWYHINAAAIKRLCEYFDFLKSSGVYDNSRIIVVSDHGCLNTSFVTKTALPFPVDQFNPVLLVKDFNAKGEMKTDMAFMTNADVPFLAVNGLIENPVNPFTGNTISSDQKDSSPLILIHRVSVKNNGEIELTPQNSFFVKDNIFDEKNWSRLGKLP
jgi:YidC/Oxa1 family membrane protein insertase